MCGIFGFSRRTPATDIMAPFLAWEMERRGNQSWGCAGGADVNILKHVGPITGSWELPDWGPGPYIFHTRQASVGDVSIENAHPFSLLSKDGNPDNVHDYVVGTHNGCVSNYKELADKYKRDFAVDSMHIFAHIAEELDVREVRGWGALAWLLRGRLHLLRFNMQDLHAMELSDGTIAYCSTEEPLEKAARMAGVKINLVYKIEGDTHYAVKHSENPDDKDELMNLGRMVFGCKMYSQSTIVYPHSSVPSHSDYDNDDDGWGYYAARHASRQQSQSHQQSQHSDWSSKPNIHDIGKYRREDNKCGVPSCKETVDRKKELFCPFHYNEGLTRYLDTLPDIIEPAAV